MDLTIARFRLSKGLEHRLVKLNKRCHCEERSDEAIQSDSSDWIASLHFVPLAMTN
jgi:hypothetical protein